MEWLSSPEIWVAFLTLTALEIVLGIDNIIFISILVGRLPKEQQPKARFFGLALAMGTRIPSTSEVVCAAPPPKPTSTPAAPVRMRWRAA